MARSFFRQGARTLRCPAEPRLDGKTALVTGGTGGIGMETVRGLLQRGARVLVACRDADKGRRVADELAFHGTGHGRPGIVALDLADLGTVGAAVDAVGDMLDGHRLDLLVENAGMWPTRFERTPQGVEIAFGTNVLGHFAFRQALMARRMLSSAARVVIVTGDIYILQSDCTPDYEWQGFLGGTRAYCRSKLGNLWIAAELRRRHPDLLVYVVHPGVIATDLARGFGRVNAWLSRQIMLSPADGAQTSLVCATQDELENGGYYHNVNGRMQLDPADPACNAEAARRLWAECESLAAAA